MPTRLAQHLVSRGLLPAEKVEEAQRRQVIGGGCLDTALLEQGLISEAGMLQALADVSGHRLVNLADFEPNTEVADLIPLKIADRLGIIPLSVEGNQVHLACSYPVPEQQLQEVGFLLGKQLELWIALECRIRDWISVLYKTPLGARFAGLLAALDPSRPMASPPSPPAALSAVAVPFPPAPAEGTTLEDSLFSPATQDALGGEEPILLTVKKVRPPGPEPRTLPPPKVKAGAAPPEETRVLDGPEYEAFAREASRPRPSGPAPLSPASTPRRYAIEMPATPPPPRTRPAVQPLGAAQPTPVAPPLPISPAARPTPVPPAPVPGQRSPPPDTGGWTLGGAAVSLAEPGESPTRKELRAVERKAPAVAPEILPMSPPSVRGPAPLGALVPGPTPGHDEELCAWTLAEARQRLEDAAHDRDALIQVALSFGRRAFDYVAAFAVVRGAATGWAARGEGADAHPIGQLSVPLDAASVFRTVALSRGSYLGPVPPDLLSRQYLERLGRGPRAMVLVPVEVRSRLVAMLYGDCGSRPPSQRRVSDFLLLCQGLPAAFQELILFRKSHPAGPGASPAEGLRVPAGAAPVAGGPAPSAPAPAPTAEAGGAGPGPGLGWSPGASSPSAGVGRTASMPALAVDDAARPPPDFGPLLRRLTGPDAALRSRAMAELARTPEASAKVLVAQFPGPTAWSRLPVVELPEADELGPIPGALARLGRPAAQALAPLLDADDSDTRYLALLTAGSLPYGELVDGVLRGLFDLEPDISSAARVAATALRRVPRFDAAMRDLRQELAARDPLRRSLAARALGVLHDRDSVDGLIGLTGSDDQMVAQAAAEALREITRTTFGTNPRQWSAWWAENRDRRRIEWVVSALRHPDVDLRLSAIEELARAFNDHLGYQADAPGQERDAAIRRWEGEIRRPQLARFDL